MFVILVCDTAAERNPQVLKTCRKYLHWAQRSVFEGELSTAQHRSLIAALRQEADLNYDSIRVYRVASPHHAQSEWLGQKLGHQDPII